jgi:hypothetical protein
VVSFSLGFEPLESVEGVAPGGKRAMDDLCIAFHLYRLKRRAGWLCGVRRLYRDAPFNPRAGLWEAETEEAWQCIRTQRGGLHTVLVSFRGFLQDCYERPDRQHPGLFHSMLLMGKYGKDELSTLLSITSVDQNKCASTSSLSSAAASYGLSSVPILDRSPGRRAKSYKGSMLHHDEP